MEGSSQMNLEEQVKNLIKENKELRERIAVLEYRINSQLGSIPVAPVPRILPQPQWPPRTNDPWQPPYTVTCGTDSNMTSNELRSSGNSK